MRRIQGEKLISALSIPGTHNTMALDGSNKWVWCQSLRLSVQLRIGLRFFDIRCRHLRNGLPIHHGAFYQNTNFYNCISDMIDFLRDNPTEMLLVRVQEEYEDAECTRSFCETVLANIQKFPQSSFWFNKEIPSINEVRGKIVILPNFASRNVLGIPYDSLVIEDHYNLDIWLKWSIVEANLENARSGALSTMYLTFNSATGFLPPGDIAKSMNPKLHGYIQGKTARFGIIAMDYPGPQLIKDIIETNF